MASQQLPQAQVVVHQYTTPFLGPDLACRNITAEQFCNPPLKTKLTTLLFAPCFFFKKHKRNAFSL